MKTHEELLKILQERKVKTTLQGIFDNAEAGLEERGRLEQILRPHMAEYAPASLFQELVVDRLPRPWATTAKDLAEAFVQHVLMRNDGAFEDNYHRFTLVVISGVFSERCTHPFECFSYESSEDFDLRELKEPILWGSQGEFVLSFNGILLKQRPFDLDSEVQEEQPHIAYVSLAGRCTAAALDAASTELANILPCMFRTFYLLAERERRERIDELMETMSLYLTQISQESLDAIQKGDSPTPEKSANTSAPDTFDKPWGGLSFLPRLCVLLDAYFSQPSKKKPLDFRLKNAVHLLCQADHQEKNAIGLALSVAAMESLLCENRGDIGKMLSENVANLLEPLPTERFNAIQFIKELYDARSSVLHGSDAEAGQSLRDNARLLAAAVLKAFLDRRQHVHRTNHNEDESPTEFFNNLEKHRYTEGPFLGVVQSSICSMWRTKK
jgi:hypothetical protein